MEETYDILIRLETVLAFATEDEAPPTQEREK